MDKLTNSLENASLRSELDTLSRTSQQDKLRISELEEVNQQLQISVNTGSPEVKVVHGVVGYTTGMPIPILKVKDFQLFLKNDVS